ncbi:hypothetical protein P4O66_006126 [Electrophorus voltai]|uniref:ethanolamine kinase n=1 Tax=Electrophorus voltai TaxID=2609070 RepID=A0AAD8ZI89_9TELE|nr:hypothetical protein P4O66_006126 [Electrophorus voltai]
METEIHVPVGSPVIRKFPIYVDEHNVTDGALRLIKELRPAWDTSLVKTKLFTDGTTNKLVGCYVEESPEDMVLVRVYGNKTELIVDRDNELKSFQVLHANGCAPRLYCTFHNGICYEFMQGDALGTQDVRDPVLLRLIAGEMARIHAIHAHNGCVPKPNLWIKMRKYFSLVATEFTDQASNARNMMTSECQQILDSSLDLSDQRRGPVQDEQLCPIVHAVPGWSRKGQVCAGKASTASSPISFPRIREEVPSKEVLEEEMAWMQQHLSQLGSPVVLCHNDLLCKNIIHNVKEGYVRFIDYEYSSYNYQAFDIGNHFNEFAAGMSQLDYSLYPSRQMQLDWLRTYLKTYKLFTKKGADVSEQELEALYVQVNKFSLASHFFWGFWALIQAKYSSIDFDFLGYAVLRFNQYFKTKPMVMTLKIPE